MRNTWVRGYHEVEILVEMDMGTITVEKYTTVSREMLQSHLARDLDTGRKGMLPNVCNLQHNFCSHRRATLHSTVMAVDGLCVSDPRVSTWVWR